MHVEDRLRRGLDANATSFVPEGEWRLVEVHRRRRQRAVTVLVAACAAAVVLAVVLLGSGGTRVRMLPGPAQPSPESTDVSRGDDGTGLPDATWFRVATDAAAASLGVPERAAAEHLGDDGRLPLALTVVDGAWAITTTGDAGEVEVGDLGRAAYDDDGDLVTTSSSSGCPGCRAVLHWRLAGDELVLTSADGSLGPVERLVTEGTWHDRQDLASTSGRARGCSSTRDRPTTEEDTMTRRPDRNTMVALAALGTLLAGCSDDSGDGTAGEGAAPEETATSVAATSEPRVVESGWERRTTEARARSLGLSPRTISRYVGGDGVLPMGMKLQQETYALYVLDDSGEPRTYDLGSYTYDDEGRLVLTTSSTACSSCATTLRWQQDGDRLTIGEVSGPGTTTLDRFVWQGAWTDPS
jgi:hypothetical protein